jgi:hypothetical protein
MPEVWVGRVCSVMHNCSLTNRCRLWITYTRRAIHPQLIFSCVHLSQHKLPSRPLPLPPPISCPLIPQYPHVSSPPLCLVVRSLWYALGLLDTGRAASVAPAVAIIKKVLPLQVGTHTVF